MYDRSQTRRYKQHIAGGAIIRPVTNSLRAERVSTLNTSLCSKRTCRKYFRLRHTCNISMFDILAIGGGTASEAAAEG